MTENIWLDGVMGVVIGDALGCPVQFIDRAELASGPVDDMEGYGTYNMPEGTWTDDSSMTLALLASIREKGGIDLPDIMYRFALWLTKGDVVPQIKRNSILHIIRDCFCDVSMNNSRLFDADSALYFI